MNTETAKKLFTELISQGEMVLRTRFEHRPDSVRIRQHVDTAQSETWSVNVVAFLGSAFGESSEHYARAKRYESQSFFYAQAVQLLAVLKGAAEAFDRGFLNLRDEGPRGSSGLEASAAFDETQKRVTMNTTTGTRSILFMDVSGWSKLGTVDIKRYVEVALPRLKPLLEEADFLNTWGDAIVATFTSAKQAAETALRIRDFFAQGTVEQGIPEGLVCRISLHQGEILLCDNALTTTRDIFGHAVHVAARLEPATAPRHVFCTDIFARVLQDIGGLGPKAWHLGTLALPKKFGEMVASVVTWPNEANPTSGLRDYIIQSEPATELAGLGTGKHGDGSSKFAAVSDGDAILVLKNWIETQLGKQDTFTGAYHALDLDKRFPSGTTKRVLAAVVQRVSGWRLEDGDAFFTLAYDPVRRN